MNSRNTKQKELILNILNQKTHPTIQDIYTYAKKQYPNIGQATIYRNVNRLVEERKIVKLPNSDNESYHYDGNVLPHDHLICKHCGKIIDIFDNNYDEILDKIEKNNSIKIDKIVVLLEGTCTSCQS